MPRKRDRPRRDGRATPTCRRPRVRQPSLRCGQTGRHRRRAWSGGHPRAARSCSRASNEPGGGGRPSTTSDRPTHLTKREDLAAYKEDTGRTPTNKTARPGRGMINAPELLVEITVTACNRLKVSAKLRGRRRRFGLAGTSAHVIYGSTFAPPRRWRSPVGAAITRSRPTFA